MERTKAKLFRTGAFSYLKWLFAFLVLLSSLLLIYTVSKVDDVPYSVVIEEHKISLSRAEGADEGRTEGIEETGLKVVCTEGKHVISQKIDLDKGKDISVKLNVINNAEAETVLSVDLYNADSGYDQAGMQREIRISPGENKKKATLPFYRTDHPDSCQVRITSYAPADLTYESIYVVYEDEMVDSSRIITIVELLLLFTATCSAFVFGYETLLAYRGGIIKDEIKRLSVKIKLSNILVFVVVNLVVLGCLIICNRHLYLDMPRELAGGDEFGVYYFSKTIDEYGISLLNPESGGVWGADMYDYTYSDTLSFGIVKFIGLFSDNPFLIINLFYYLCFFLVANICVASMLYLGIDRIITIVMSCLYGFTPYITIRYAHMWLVPFFMMPVACVIAIDIIKGRYLELEGAERKRYYSRMLFLSFCCAFTGMYYAYFACALICVALVVALVNSKKGNTKSQRYIGGYLAAVISAVIVQIIPNILYFYLHGFNVAGELSLRSRSDSEFYGLKLVNLVLPRPGHRVAALNNIYQKYASGYPLVTENIIASLGAIASVGLIISLVLLLKKDSKHPEISYLIVATLLIATVGGVSSVISVMVALPVRCYNRMSVIVMYLALLQVGYSLEEVKARINTKVFYSIMAVLLTVGLYDQTVTYGSMDFSGFNSTKEFVSRINDELDDRALVYELPFHNWPSAGYYGTFYGYVLSDKDIRWSYGAMQGRGESEWQKAVGGADIPVMVDELRKAGYSGLYLDCNVYNSCNNADLAAGTIETADDYAGRISELLGKPDVVSANNDMFFWRL